MNEYAGAGGTGRLVLTALNGAAGGDVSGSVGGLVQGAAVGVLQGLATQQVKKLADTLQSEQARTALQALVGCAGSAAAGGDCGAGAMGAAGSVVLNNLLKTGATPAVDAQGNPLSPSEQQARETLVATLVGAIAEAAGLDANAAVTAARIETGNNAVNSTKNDPPPCNLAQRGLQKLGKMGVEVGGDVATAGLAIAGGGLAIAAASASTLVLAPGGVLLGGAIAAGGADVTAGGGIIGTGGALLMLAGGSGKAAVSELTSRVVSSRMPKGFAGEVASNLVGRAIDGLPFEFRLCK